jgi:hypothetical protein
LFCGLDSLLHTYRSENLHCPFHFLFSLFLDFFCRKKEGKEGLSWVAQSFSVFFVGCREERGGGDMTTMEVGKVLYIVVVDEEEKRDKGKGKGKGKDSFRYTRPVLQSALQLMGCKARHAFKVTQIPFSFLVKFILEIRNVI